MIETKELTKVYGTGSRVVRAVDGARLSLEAGDFALVIGRSGSGKSTLLGMLGAVTRPTQGKVLLDGDDLWEMDDRAQAMIRARKIGFVFQFAGLLPTLTAMENAKLPSLFSEDKEGSVKRAERYFKAFGIEDKMLSFPSQLSGGEAKRVSIVRALVNDPVLVIADEPTGDLDIDTEKDIMSIFQQINKDGRTIVMVTHNPELSSYANKVFRMDRGILSKVDLCP
ncbi:MAG: ABC transporter ATP-binding protein [Methanomassiliicoccales archaeon]|jgi:ABC-type lipoprotein export system ATPase subunit